MIAFCREQGIPLRCGKIVLAVDDEVVRPAELERRGLANGARPVSMVTPNRFRSWSLRAGAPAARAGRRNCGLSRGGAAVAAFGERRAWPPPRASPASRRMAPTSGRDQLREHRADFLVNCGGLHCDRIGRCRPAPAVPHRPAGIFQTVHAQRLVKHLIYPS